MSYGTNAPSGLRPSQYLNGTLYTGQTSEYLIQHAYATALFSGDPVTLLNDGTIGIGVAGSGIIGVFQGCKFIDPNGVATFLPYWPASQSTQGNTYATALVADDPNILFDVQTNATPGLAVTNLNNNANFVAGAGSTVSGLSGFMLNQSTCDTTVDRNLKLIRFTPVPGNGPTPNPTGYNNVLCLINNHIAKGGTGTLGA